MINTYNLEPQNSVSKRPSSRAIPKSQRFSKTKTYYTKAVLCYHSWVPHTGREVTVSHCNSLIYKINSMKYELIHSQPIDTTNHLSSYFAHPCLTFRRKITTNQVKSMPNLKSPWCIGQRFRPIACPFFLVFYSSSSNAHRWLSQWWVFSSVRVLVTTKTGLPLSGEWFILGRFTVVMTEIKRRF